jgi:hypothetical protein
MLVGFVWLGVGGGTRHVSTSYGTLEFYKFWEIY